MLRICSINEMNPDPGLSLKSQHALAEIGRASVWGMLYVHEVLRLVHRNRNNCGPAGFANSSQKVCLSWAFATSAKSQGNMQWCCQLLRNAEHRRCSSYLTFASNIWTTLAKPWLQIKNPVGMIQKGLRMAVLRQGMGVEWSYLGSCNIPSMKADATRDAF